MNEAVSNLTSRVYLGFFRALWYCLFVDRCSVPVMTKILGKFSDATKSDHKALVIRKVDLSLNFSRIWDRLNPEGPFES